MVAVWILQTAHWALSIPHRQQALDYQGWPRLSYQVPSTSPRITLGMRSEEALKSGRKPLGQGGDGTAGFQMGHLFGAVDSSLCKHDYLLWEVIAEPSKLCVPVQGLSYLGLKVIILCPGVYSNLLIMKDARNVLSQFSLGGRSRCATIQNVSHACAILLFWVD